MSKFNLHKFEKAVNKATNSRVEPPKRKHVRSIIIDVHHINSAGLFLEAIFGRPLAVNDVVCFKSLITVHRVLLEGPPQSLIDARQRSSYFRSLASTWHAAPERGFSALNEALCLFLIEKIELHEGHPAFTGNYDITQYSMSHFKPQEVSKK